MPKFSPQPWRTVEAVFIAAGLRFDRQEGSHRSYVKPGVARPVVKAKGPVSHFRRSVSDFRTNGRLRELRNSRPPSESSNRITALEESLEISLARVFDGVLDFVWKHLCVSPTGLGPTAFSWSDQSDCWVKAGKAAVWPCPC